MVKSFLMMPEPQTRSRSYAAYTAPFLVFVLAYSVDRQIDRRSRRGAVDNCAHHNVI